METQGNKKKIPICPMSMSNPNGEHICLQENCAWYMSNTKTCAVYVVGHNNVLEIKQKQGK